MNIAPVDDRVLVKIIDPESMRGEIIIPDEAKEKAKEGIIIAKGKGKVNEHGMRIPLEVNVGDKVLFNKYVSNAIKVDDEDHIIMYESDIYGILEG